MSFKERQLKTLLSEMLREAPETSDSNFKLLSYVRAYIALYRLLTVNPVRKEFGDRNEYTRKADLLFKIIFERAVHTRDFAEKSRLLSALFSLTYGTAFVSDAEKDNLCRTEVVALMREYEESREASDTDRLKEDILTGFCRCLTDFYYSSTEEDEADEWFLFLKNKIAQWSETLAADGSWQEVADNTALERIEIMNRNSFLLLDVGHDEQIRSAYRYYSRRILLRKSKGLNTLAELTLLGALYEVALQENAYGADRETAQEIVGILRACSDHLPEGREERFYCLSYRIDCLCEEILEEDACK